MGTPITNSRLQSNSSKLASNSSPNVSKLVNNNRKSMVSSNSTGNLNPFKQADQAKRASMSLSGSPVMGGIKKNSALDKLLRWTQNTTFLQNIEINNLTTSWKDGIAFCALLTALGFDSEIQFDKLVRT